MTDTEIREEAERRIAAMSEREKKEIWGFPEADNSFLDYVDKVGTSGLTPEERSRFRSILVHYSSASMTGGVFQGALITHLKEVYNITTDDLRAGAANPIRFEILKTCVIGLIIAVIGGVLAFVGVRCDMEWLKYFGLAMECGLGVLAMRFANEVSAYFKVRKLQKKCMSGEIDEELIRTEVLNRLFAERKRLWDKKA